MVIIVKERGFYYMRHNIQDKEKRKYLGKVIPNNIPVDFSNFIY